MSALICGSFAYDTIMVFQDQFKKHILPDKTHMINVSFLVPEMRKEFGGCAGNIAYNLKLLGAEPIPMGAVGKDFAPYANWLNQHGICQDHIKEIADSYTAQAFITTDLDDNQITAFHPGAMSFAHQNTVNQAENISIGIISPDGREGMIQHAQQFKEANIPFIFDPGQGMPMFDGQDLLNFIDQAQWITVNDYEAQLMQERTGLSAEQIAKKVDALIITLGHDGSIIYTDNKEIKIPPATVSNLADPTGCGDAYRGGILYGLLNEMEWEVTGRIASLAGAIKIEQHGTQNHHFSRPDFDTRFKNTFGFMIGG